MIFPALRHTLFASILVLTACSNSDEPETSTDTRIVKPSPKDAAPKEPVADKPVLADAGSANDAAKTAEPTEADVPPEGIEPAVDMPATKGLINIKALPKKWSEKQVKRYMVGITKGLGVKCAYCHVKGDNASDDNKHKIAARQMITMTRSLDRRFMKGKGLVTCKTCHHGSITSSW